MSSWAQASSLVERYIKLRYVARSLLLMIPCSSFHLQTAYPTFVILILTSQQCHVGLGNARQTIGLMEADPPSPFRPRRPPHLAGARCAHKIQQGIGNGGTHESCPLKLASIRGKADWIENTGNRRAILLRDTMFPMLGGVARLPSSTVAYLIHPVPSLLLLTMKGISLGHYDLPSASTRCWNICSVE